MVKSQIAGGALTATTGLAYETTSTGTADTEMVASTGSQTGAVATSTSKGLAAAQATGLMVSMVGALGVLGLALVL